MVGSFRVHSLYAGSIDSWQTISLLCWEADTPILRTHLQVKLKIYAIYGSGKTIRDSHHSGIFFLITEMLWWGRFRNDTLYTCETGFQDVPPWIQILTYMGWQEFYEISFEILFLRSFNWVCMFGFFYAYFNWKNLIRGSTLQWRVIFRHNSRRT